MVCIPSVSSRTSSGLFPWTWFQYWDVAIGILLMVKYLLSPVKGSAGPASSAGYYRRSHLTGHAPTVHVAVEQSVEKTTQLSGRTGIVDRRAHYQAVEFHQP